MTDPSASLNTVLTTDELASRCLRPPDFDAVNEAFGTLLMANLQSPEAILQRFAQLLIQLCNAHSAGVSILEEENGHEVFRWHAIAGVYAPYRWGTMSRYASPCGVVLKEESVQLFKYPERYFPYSIPLNPPICEALLTPFRLNENVIGTAWLISHEETRTFDKEDLRRMQNLLRFTAVSYDIALNRI
jgi:GAF domain